jgi:SAM-dependent methyltransferase
LCVLCGRSFTIREEVGALVLEGTSLEGAAWGDEWTTTKRAVYGRTAANAEQSYATNPTWRGLVDAALGCRGLVVDIATGPGGSLRAPFLRRAPQDVLFVASDLGEAVMRGQHAFFQCLGLGAKASFLAFDARRMPFLDGAASAITSVVGFTNISESLQAYQEAARVLKDGGRLIDASRVYEPGSQSADAVRQWGGCHASLQEWLAALCHCGFTVERTAEWVSGKGKGDPADGLPIDDECWTNVIVYARK